MSPKGKPHSPQLTFFPLRPGLPSLPGLPWEEAEAVRVPQHCPQPRSQQGCRAGEAEHR